MVLCTDGMACVLSLLLIVACVVVDNAWYKPALQASAERKMYHGNCTYSPRLAMTCEPIYYGTEVRFVDDASTSTTSTNVTFIGVNVRGEPSQHQCALQNEDWSYSFRLSCKDEACTKAACEEWARVHAPPSTPCCHNQDESSCHVIPANLKYQAGRRSYTATSSGAYCIVTAPFNPMTYLSVLFVSVYCLASIVAALSCFGCSGAFQRSVLKEEGAEDMDCCLYTLTRSSIARVGVHKPNLP